MFKRESYKAKMREIGLMGSASRPTYKQKTELVRTKRCRSNNSSQNKRQLITVIDNFIHKINDRRKASVSESPSSASASSTDSTKTATSDQRHIKARIKDSPRLILKSTQNYIRSFKRPCQINSLRGQKETRSDLFFDHFSSNRVEELQNSSILKSLLDSHQYLMLQKSLSQSNFNESSSSENSNTSCIIHDCSDDSDSNSNQTFVEHSDDSYTTCEQTNETKNQASSTIDQTDGYKFLLAKLDASYLKSPNSIVNKVQIPSWIMELSNFRENSIQWDSLDLKSLELYDLMLQRIHKNELMSLIEKHEVYRTKLNEMLTNS